MLVTIVQNHACILTMVKDVKRSAIVLRTFVTTDLDAFYLKIVEMVTMVRAVSLHVDIQALVKSVNTCVYVNSMIAITLLDAIISQVIE
ncbi:uncharacterized protein LOC128190514 isoform X1 [Crassostrea angulata]|uniref:uncharacterized protein LOC128190514 isoform X1 n=1 Tax=Magallana angulata TaxID=2784310 RepID=UPI0022B12A06|nr:uncharacterized protein LOC128190514 isoform X1 [Crassostrea angulata]